MRGNLTTQGYCLSDAERRELAVALRFSTGLCLSLVVAALALESPAMVFAPSAVGVVAGFTTRRPSTISGTSPCGESSVVRRCRPTPLGAVTRS